MAQPVSPSHSAGPIDEQPSIEEWHMNAIIYRLTAIHRRIDEEIRSELKRRLPDSIRLLRLKKLRLAVKDRLHRQQLRARRI